MRSTCVSLVLLGALALSGCGSQTAQPEPSASPAINLQVPPGVLQQVATVTLAVTGPGMSAITRNMDIQGQQATLTLSVPAGDDRVFDVTAKDAANTVLATGSSGPVDLAAGDSRTITITLDVAWSIVGSWRIDYDATWYEILTFESGGGYEDYIYLDGDVYTFAGTYQISGDQVTITVEGSSTTFWYQISADGEELTLTDDQGWSWTFYRVGS